jgi:nucleoside diphosphate kinase
MTSIKQLFENQQAGFSVYSPDCTQSRLWGNLDHAIHKTTGFQVVYRQWINHDVNSIGRFYSGADEEPPPEQDPDTAAKRYDSIPPEELKYGHLVVKLFLSGPSLLTIWRGEKVIETLLTLKGATHPSEALSGSIRGRFWCDNGVCNLVHTSDNVAEAERELRAIHLLHVLDEEAVEAPLIDPIVTPPSYIAHSGMVVVCEVVNRTLMSTRDVKPVTVQLPPSGDAKETNRVLTEVLQQTAQRLPENPLAHFINAYLAGDLVTVTGMLRQMPTTRWEDFIVQCGVITRYKWAATL